MGERVVPVTSTTNGRKEHMSSNGTSGSNGGIGFVWILTIVFIVLKLTDVIDWSWWWVLSPLWIPFAAMLAVLLVCIFFIALIGKR